MKTLLTIASIVFISNCVAQVYSKSDFSVCEISKEPSSLLCLSDTSNNNIFSVSINSKKLQVLPYNYNLGNQYSWGNGKLLRLDMGEWGGGLYFKPNDVNKKSFFVNGKLLSVNEQLESRYRDFMKDDSLKALITGKHLLIAGGNIKAISSYCNGWIFTQGWVDMTGDHGLLLNLTTQNDSFKVSKIFSLNTIPQAIAVYNDKLFVVTSTGFYSIKNEKVLVSIESSFWGRFYANSIAVIDERNIYLGGRSGYVKIDLLSKEIQFFRYKKL